MIPLISDFRGGFCLIVLWLLFPGLLNASEWPGLPDQNGAVELPAQEWPLRPGTRTIKVLVHYPHADRQRINANTGLMLSLHNWGGVDCDGSAAPQELADRLNVVTLCVNYLQSGPEDSTKAPEPYDCGYLQALDALRSLWWLRDRLIGARLPFDDGRIYTTGGSGGGNVSLMANKLAPRTFTCVIDMCGLKKLSDDIAFNLPGGTELNARWSRDPANPYYLSPGNQQIRFIGCPEHLWMMKRLGSTARIFVVHGVEDIVCPFADAKEMVKFMQGHRLDVVPRFISANDLDGTVFKSAGHPLGNRTEIVFKVANDSLEGKDFRRAGRTDFDRREEIRYRTSDGEFLISYQTGYPIGRFEPKASPTDDQDRVNLTTVTDEQGQTRPLGTVDDWNERRGHVRTNFERVAGPLPSPEFRVPLDVQIQSTEEVGDLLRRKLTYQSDPYDRVSAILIQPANLTAGKLPAVLCLHQTTPHGKGEPAGMAGDPSLHYALELARRGYAVIAPDYPSFGEHPYDFGEKTPYQSGTMKAIWDNLRAIDYLESLHFVDRSRIGVIGHSLGGHNAIFTALFDDRLKAVVSSCGFCRFDKDDVPSWTGPRYMPLIATEFGSDANRLPFDFPELIAAIAPRAFFASAALKDADFDVVGVRETTDAARRIYDLYGESDRLQAYYPNCDHGFPDDARANSYRFLDQMLEHRPVSVQTNK